MLTIFAKKQVKNFRLNKKNKRNKQKQMDYRDLLTITCKYRKSADSLKN